MKSFLLLSLSVLLVGPLTQAGGAGGLPPSNQCVCRGGVQGGDELICWQDGHRVSQCSTSSTPNVGHVHKRIIKNGKYEETQTLATDSCRLQLGSSQFRVVFTLTQTQMVTYKNDQALDKKVIPDTKFFSGFTDETELAEAGYKTLTYDDVKKATRLGQGQVLLEGKNSSLTLTNLDYVNNAGYSIGIKGHVQGKVYQGQTICSGVVNLEEALK